MDTIQQLGVTNMSEEVVRVKKERVVEEEEATLTITVSGKFMDDIERAKASVEKESGKDYTYGEYIEAAMNDLVKMVGSLQADLQTAMSYAGMLPEVKASEDDPLVKELEEVSDDEKDQMYGHLAPDTSDDPNYG